ncbi:MAG TPA: hypothetical protein GXX55_10870 [Firmicutes bacterium]|nr:hypothetical protein [Bacillota bacterium]
MHVYQYNSRGLKTKEDAGRPEEIRWTYDVAGRVKRVEYPNGTSVDYTYNGDGMSYITTASLLENGTLSKVEVRKNLRGWVTLQAWEIDGVRYEIRHAYDDPGNRTSMTYPDGTTVSFGYNERNRLVRIPGFSEGPVAGAWTDNAGFRYDANGFLIGMRSVNGIETTFQPGSTLTPVMQRSGYVRAFWAREAPVLASRSSFAKGSRRGGMRYPRAWKMVTASGDASERRRYVAPLISIWADLIRERCLSASAAVILILVARHYLPSRLSRGEFG